MKNTYLLSIICTTLCVAALPTLANDKPGKGNKAGKQATSTAEHETKAASKEPWVAASVRISDNERRVICGYVKDYPAHAKRGKKSKKLPPGLAKKVARGEPLPPGWQKKCVAGQVMPVEVFERTHPLPPDLVVKLPPPPSGTITVVIGGKVVRLLQATREILDVFDVHVPGSVRVSS